MATMRTLTEITDVLSSLLEEVKIGTIDPGTAKATRLVADKLVTLGIAIEIYKNSQVKYSDDMTDRLLASAERLDTALDIYLRGNISKEELKEIKAAKSQGNAILREFKQVNQGAQK
jgi:hypothetical protein